MAEDIIRKLNGGGIEEENSLETKKFTDDFGKDTANRPTKCQICRILSHELLVEMNRTSDIKKSYFATSRIDWTEVRVNEREQKNKIDYQRSEIRLLDVLDTVCNNVYNYRAVVGPAFPYLRGVQSVLEQALNSLADSAGLPLRTDAPAEALNDPTSEIKRMFYGCQHMVEKYEDHITEWYMGSQEEDPLEYLCAHRVLKSRDQGCLHASTEIPAGFTKPQPIGNDQDRGKFNYRKNYEKEL